MENKTVAKLFLVAGGILIIAAMALSYLMFAMRDGPIGAGAYLFASALLAGGIVLLVLAKKRYGQ